MTKKTVLLFGFILFKFILQYSLISSDYDLQRDEYLHLDQAHHLAWGYQSVPPFTSWISYIIYLLGNSVFWIKFFPALFGALTIVVVWKAIKELKGNLFALVLGATCVLFSSLLRLNTLYQPNSFDVLCWTTFYFILIKYFNSENTKWLFIGAVVFAFGFLNKYNIGFLFIGLVPALLVTKQRKIFVQPKLYVALILGLLIITPNLLWQFQNNFPVIHHLKELADTQLVHVDRLDFLKSQLFFFIGSFLVIVSGLVALLFYKPFRKYKPFFWSLLFTLAVFIYFKAKDYYAIGLYPIYIAFGAVFLGEQLKEGWKRYLTPVLIVFPMLVFIRMYKTDFPNKSPEYIVTHAKEYEKYGLHRWEDGKEHLLQQDFADMVGWKELAVKVDSVCATMPDLEHTLILCDNYGQAGAINYYTTNKKVVASSFNADYINWLPLDMKIKNVILVKEEDDDDPERKVEIPLFDTVYLATKRINKYAREPEISIYLLKGAKIDVNKRIKEEMEEEKN
jgi:hypothetical protein